MTDADTKPVPPSELVSWTIYFGASDVPAGLYAARKFIGGKPIAHTLLSDRIDTLRQILGDSGLICFERSPNDDPVIVETWL